MNTHTEQQNKIANHFDFLYSLNPINPIQTLISACHEICGVETSRHNSTYSKISDKLTASIGTPWPIFATHSTPQAIRDAISTILIDIEPDEEG